MKTIRIKTSPTENTISKLDKMQNATQFLNSKSRKYTEIFLEFQEILNKLIME